MTFQQRYSSIFIRAGVLFFCLLASVSPVLAESLILTQPVSQTICKADYSIEFEVVPNPGHSYVIANPGHTFQYQWYEWDETASNWKAILFANGSMCTAYTAGKYYCEIWYHSIDTKEPSNEVTLTINNVPSISGIQVKSACSGDELKAGIDAVLTNGSDLEKYVWTLGGVTIKNDFITDNTVPGVTYSNIDVSQDASKLKITVTNGCGSASDSVSIRVWEKPSLPSPIERDYCRGETAEPLSIIEDDPIWYNDATGAPRPDAPIPDTNVTGQQSWWVSRQIYHHEEAVCESDRRKVTVEVFPVPDPPATKNDTVLCLNEASFTLEAQGSGIKWYNDKKNSIPIAPQINTSIVGPQIYYVTQTVGKCESRIDDGKITVQITGRSETDSINIPESMDLCPYSSTTIVASSQVQNPVFRWYRNDNKTGWIKDTASLETPVLTRDTIYYVTIRYGGLCESSYPKATVIHVRDITLPQIIAPPSIVVDTDEGVCYASNVDIGRPVVSDNCTDLDKLVVYTDLDKPGIFPTYFLPGDTTLTWTVVDEAGNRSRGLQTVSVRDREKPRGTCPADTIIEINDNEYSAVFHYQLNYTDNCSAVKDSLDAKMGLPSGSAFPLGETRVRHFLTDEAGNTAICEFKVIVQHPYRVPVINLMLNKSSICPGEQVVITPQINGGSGRFNYSWKQPFNWSEATMRDYPLDNTTYEVTISDGVSPPQTLQTHVTVLDTRQVELTLEGRRMDEIFEGDEVLVTATSGFSSYKLLLNNEVMQTSGLNNGVSFQAELGIYIVRVFATDFSDCVTQDQLEILVDSRRLPNVFTPNYDGKNDIFLEGFDLKVFSRAGELLYKGTGGWDGTYKGKMMPQGTYLYVVERIMNNGQLRIFKGEVTLKQ